jgi:DNA-binding NarL/FixJ family response regulator
VKCLSTRTTPEGFKRRRYQSAGGLRHTTIEIPFEVWQELNKDGKGTSHAAAVAEAQDSASRQLQVISLLRSGMPAIEVSMRTGIQLSTVHRWGAGG